MLDAIADFWKPVKKIPAVNKAKLDDLQLGSTVGFGFVPQASLSGKRLIVSSINTYRFGEDVLTSFVLSQDKDPGASMIVAEAEGEKYLAISRRMTTGDRGRLFSQEELEAVISREDIKSIRSKEGVTDYKGWIVPSYRREMKGMKGKLCKGDFRKIPVDLATDVADFTYTLLVSDSNEHALEIEKYSDGRLEVYATVYRRLSDIGEITHPDVKLQTEARNMPAIDTGKSSPSENNNGSSRPSPVFSSNGEKKIVNDSRPSPKLETVGGKDVKDASFKPKSEVRPLPSFEEKKQQVVDKENKDENKPDDVQVDVKSTPVKLPEFDADKVSGKTVEEPEIKEEDKKPAEPSKEVMEKTDAILENIATKREAVTKVTQEEVPQPSAVVSRKQEASEVTNKTTIKIQHSNQQPFTHQEIKAVSKDETTNFINESIDCDLPIANRIIDEAIRSEMRINDVVRRVIGLPVSAQESVQIPVTLTDQDYALLAIRYGISANDREAIKTRIIEDLGDFSGVDKAKKAA